MKANRNPIFTKIVKYSDENLVDHIFSLKKNEELHIDYEDARYKIARSFPRLLLEKEN